MKVWVFQLQKVHVQVKCRGLSASIYAFYPLQHPYIAYPHFTPGKQSKAKQNMGAGIMPWCPPNNNNKATYILNRFIYVSQTSITNSGYLWLFISIGRRRTTTISYLDSSKLIQPILKCIHGMRQNHRQDFRNGTPPKLYILHTKLFYILLRMLFWYLFRARSSHLFTPPKPLFCSRVPLRSSVVPAVYMCTKEKRSNLCLNWHDPPQTLPLPLHRAFFLTYPFIAGYIKVFEILFRLRLSLASWVG